MRTTLDLDDDLYRRLKATAALRGETVRTLLTRAIERELEASTSLDALRATRDRPPLDHG